MTAEQRDRVATFALAGAVTAVVYLLRLLVPGPFRPFWLIGVNAAVFVLWCWLLARRSANVR
jgi:hypothetical protein